MINSLRSTTARLALAVTGSFLLAFVLLGVGVRFRVSTLLDSDTRDVVRADEAGLLQLERGEGLAQLTEELLARIEDDPGDGEYMLLDPAGRVLAGTLQRMPAHPAHAQWLQFAENTDTGRVRVIARLHRLPAGALLMTGQRTRSQDRFLSMMVRTALAAALVAATLGALTGWLTSRWVSRRLRDLDATAARVAEGELGLRARVDDSDDAFDRLARRFNAMLDRIEDLLGAVRHATDHIAHDLRTPLTRLRNRLEELRANPAAATAGLDAALAETDQLLHAFGALLRLARIEAQPSVSEEPAIDFAELVGDAIELYTPVAAERGIALAVALDESDVRGDRDQMFQLVVNLLDNALKYAPADSTVRIGLERTPEGALLSIDDQGPGVPAADRERVFDRFQRLEAHRGSPGNGLGLSLVRAIVQRHGGQVRLVDLRPGLGVRITMPRVSG